MAEQFSHLDSGKLDASNKLEKGKNVKDSISSPPHQIDPNQTKSINPIKHPKRTKTEDLPLSDNKKQERIQSRIESLIRSRQFREKLPEHRENRQKQEELNLSNTLLSHLDISTLVHNSQNDLKKLNLSGCGLTKLPEGLKDCHKLEELNLSNNRLSHSGISSLKYIPWHSLKKLDLSCCGLTGLPEGLKDCDKLEELNISNNSLSHSDISSLKYIPWCSLKKLDLSCCGLTVSHEVAVEDCGILEELNLSNNHPTYLTISTLIRESRDGLKKLDLSGCGLTKLPGVLEDCHKLEELNLSNNSLSHSDISSLKYIPWNSLKKLNLSGCGLTLLPDYLEDCEELEELNLSNNRLSHSDISSLKYIPSHSLKKLDLSCCGLSVLPEDLKDCDKLEELNLSNNRLSHSGLSSLKYIPWRSLKKLDLSGCGLTLLPDYLEDCHKLEELNLSNNNLSHSDISSLKYIPWRSLKKLDLSCCGLTVSGEVAVEDCGILEELNLSNNHPRYSTISTLIRRSRDGLKKLDLSGCGLTKLPDYLQNCHKLEELNLSNNRLSHSDISFLKYIPWHSLKKLDLSCCGLTGLPDHLRYCHRLEELNLSNNRLSHPDISSLKYIPCYSLKKLDLSCCGLSVLPEYLKDCHKLEELNLSNNNLFHSDISSLKYIPWRSLKKLDLSCCGLTVSREVAVEDCGILEELDLSNNHPTYLTISTLIRRSRDGLKKLDLSGCGLTKLPGDLEDCHKLEELNLSNNSLSHPDISSLKYIPCYSLKKLDLSCCGLSVLPEYLKDCHKLEELNLSNNNLIHSDISSLKYIPWRSLKKLDLSCCGLTVSREVAVEDCGILEELNLSNNHPTYLTISTLIRRSIDGLKKLDLSGCGLTKLPGDLEHCHKLEELNLSNNSLSHSGISSLKYIPCYSLKKLDLSGCGLTKLPGDLKYCYKLEELNLSNNSLSHSDISSLKYMPWHCLKKLNLSGCGLKEWPYVLQDYGDLQELNLSNNSYAHRDLLKILNRAILLKSNEKKILQPMHSGWGVTKLTKIIFEDAVYKQINEAWTVEWLKESQEEKNNDEIDNKDPISNVPEYSFLVIKGSGQTSDNSITITEEGGCFHVPVASVVLLFPPNAVEEEVTLTFSRVRHKDCEVKPRDGEVFVSQILKIEPEGVKFKKPVTVLLSHSLYEDQDFVYFYELIVENLTTSGCHELKTERIRSIEDLPKEISNKEILNNYLPFARTCIHEACTLVAATRVMSEHISVPTDGSYTFSKQYGDSAQLKITFPSGVAEETLSLKVQLFPVDAVLKKEIRLNKDLVCSPVIRVSGQTKTFLKAVDVELTYSHSDVVNIEEEFLPVGKTIQFTHNYGLLLRSQKETESITKWQNLNESTKVCIERPKQGQLKFSFSVEHFSDVQSVTKTEAVSYVPPTSGGMVEMNNPAVHRAIVLAVHDTVKRPKTLHAVLAPTVLLGYVEKRFNVKNENKIRKFNKPLRSGEPIYFCVPMSDNNDDDHLLLKDYILRFDPDPEIPLELDNNTEEKVDLNGRYMHFLKDNECNKGKNHRVAAGQDCCAKAPVHITEARPVQASTENHEVMLESESPQGGIFLSGEEDAHKNNYKISEVVRRCELFEKALETASQKKLEINEAFVKDPRGGNATKIVDVAGPTATVIASLVCGIAILVGVPTFGAASFAAAFVAGGTLGVKIVDKRCKQTNAKVVEKVLETAREKEKISSYLNCVVKDVAKELSRIFESQFFELQSDKQVEILAECAVDLMLDLKKGDTFDRNTLLKKVLHDGNMKKKKILTRTKDIEWYAPNVFRKPGLRRMIFGKDDVKFKYFVKPNEACKTWKYGYRGQFLEAKKYQNDEDETFAMDETPPTDETLPTDETPTTGETHNEDPCEFCRERFLNHGNSTSSRQYFSESGIDSQYTEDRDEILTYHPIHILIQCPKVLESFNQLEEENPSLANFLRSKLGFPEHHLVQPVYRPHSPGKVPDFQNSDLTGSDFSHADFTNSTLKNCDFTKCVMLFTDLARAKVSGSKFVDTFISHSNLEKVEADHCEWTKTSLLHSNVNGAYLNSVEPSVGGNCFNWTNVSDAITGKKRKSNWNEKQPRAKKASRLDNNSMEVEADQCDGTKTSPLHSNVDGPYLNPREPSTSGNFFEETNISNAISGQMGKLNCSETAV